MEGLVGELSSAAFGSGEDAARPPAVLALAARRLALRPAFSPIAQVHSCSQVDLTLLTLRQLSKPILRAVLHASVEVGPQYPGEVINGDGIISLFAVLPKM
jgi:hypothetical protein